jgi:acyl-CoA thioester hydrolase
MTNRPAPTLDRFPFTNETDIRHSDTDRLGHVNNVAFAAFLEFGRAAMLHELVRATPNPGHIFVIVRLEIDYRAEMRWPGKVAVGVGIERIGTASFSVVQGLYNDGVLTAEARSVLVMMNETTRKSAPLTPALVAALGRLKYLASDDA